MHIGRRSATLTGLLFLLGAAVIHGGQAAQTTGAQAAGENTFTGKSWRIDNNGVALSRRGFEAGARSDWHSHGAAQVIYVEEGRMRYQIQGQPMKELGPHESAYLPGGVAHWHGAAPNQAATQSSLTFGGGIKWMDKVNDDQYAGKGKR
jgi:quercetin dioxygenase-like cupin family protein